MTELTRSVDTPSDAATGVLIPGLDSWWDSLKQEPGRSALLIPAGGLDSESIGERDGNITDPVLPLPHVSRVRSLSQHYAEVDHFMTTPQMSACPACGQDASGRFCANCGTLLDSGGCAGCRAPMAAGARFCAACGRPATPTGGQPAALHRGSLGPGAIVGSLLIVAAVVAVLAVRSGDNGTTTGAAATAVGASTAPDISNLSPREQFGRLADRIERAMSSGDTATVIQFFPMAEGAFTNLTPEDRDADARFHVSLLRARVGHAAPALAQADTIAMSDSTHLFAYYLRAIIGDSEGDTGGAAQARANFRLHYDREIARQLPEYVAHREMLEQFLASVPASQ